MYFDAQHGPYRDESEAYLTTLFSPYLHTPQRRQPDTVTGHHPGWIPVDYTPDSVYHLEAFNRGRDSDGKELTDGTYELCGPKIQGNPEGFHYHVLVRHGADVLYYCPRDFEGIRAYLQKSSIEGVVWHHPDGRLVKIKKKDFA